MVCRMKIVMAVERFMPMLLKMLSAWDLRLSSILKLTCAIFDALPVRMGVYQTIVFAVKQLLDMERNFG